MRGRSLFVGNPEINPTHGSLFLGVVDAVGSLGPTPHKAILCQRERRQVPSCRPLTYNKGHLSFGSHACAFRIHTPSALHNSLVQTAGDNAPWAQINKNQIVGLHHTGGVDTDGHAYLVLLTRGEARVAVLRRPLLFQFPQLYVHACCVACRFYWW